MKQRVLILTLLSALTLSVEAQNEIGNDFFSHLKEGVRILDKDGLIEGEKKVKKFVSGFKSDMKYTKDFSIEVHRALDYEIGEIQVNSTSFNVMFLKNKGGSSDAKIEFLVIYEKENPADEGSMIDAQRNEWMKFCNAHQASKLVENLYTSNAYYYNRGRLIEGTKALSAEYGYMNSQGYSLKLTPKHVTFVTPNIAYEIGRCSGSYPYPYMLLWEKQDDGKWQVLMDSNY